MQRSAAAVRRKVFPARFTAYAFCAYVNPGTNAAIPTRGSSKWMMMTKTTASRRSMKLWMPTVLLIESECNKQRSFIAFIIVIGFHLCNHCSDFDYIRMDISDQHANMKDSPFQMITCYFKCSDT